MSTPPVKLPEILEKIADLVLAHKPKTGKAKTTKKRKQSPKPVRQNKN